MWQSGQIAQNVNNGLKHWCFYLVTDSIGLLEDDSLSPLMCIDTAVLVWPCWSKEKVLGCNG